MAVAQRVQILTDKAAELAVLSEYLKNPKLIDQLKEEVKSLNALTAEEEKKANEARGAIALHEAQKKELADQSSNLEDSKLAHAIEVGKFDTEKENTLSQLAAKKAELDALAVQLTGAQQTHALNASKLESDKADLLSKYEAAFAELTADKNANEKTKLALDVRATELTKAEQAHKEKAAKLKGLLTE